MANEKTPWRYCVVGNIVETHIDENGILRYGTVAYSGGTKVYLCGRFWEKDWGKISVLGKTRGSRRYQVTDVLPELLENVRCQKVYRPVILTFMDYFEFTDCWWGNTPEDKAATEDFVHRWNIKR